MNKIVMMVTFVQTKRQFYDLLVKYKINAFSLQLLITLILVFPTKSVSTLWHRLSYCTAEISVEFRFAMHTFPFNHSHKHNFYKYWFNCNQFLICQARLLVINCSFPSYYTPIIIFKLNTLNTLELRLKQRSLILLLLLKIHLISRFVI